MRHPIRFLLPLIAPLALVATSAGRPAAAQEPTPLTPEQLVAVEKIRPQVEALLARLHDPENDPAPPEDRFEVISEAFAALGPDVGPFLAAELDLPDTSTFHVASYVLGLVDDPGAVAALRRATDVADREGGAFGLARKQWTIYGLALHGDAEAVDLAVSGETPVGWVEFVEGYRLLEVVSVLTAPASVPKLLGLLQRFDADETLHPELDVALMALGAVGERSTVPPLLPFLKHKRTRARAEAARALGRIGDPAAVEPLLAALKDSDSSVQVEAAIALQKIRPSGRLEELLAALETADDPDVRGRLYRTVIAIGGEPTLEVLRANARRPPVLNRTLVAAAVGELGSRKGLNLLRANLTDDSPDVLITSIRAIAQIGGEGAVDTLVALVGDPRRLVVQTAIEALTDSGATRAGPRIAQRLLSDFLAAPVRDPEVRTLVEKSCEALVRLRYVEPREDMRAAAARQTNPEVAELVVRAAGLLDVLAAKGGDDAKWIEALDADDAALSSLAASRLSDLGTARGAAALATAFGKAQPPRAEEILAALARSGSAATQLPLLVKIVKDTAWDAERRRAERAWAAWGLRRIGGPQAKAALEASVQRRGGADWAVLLCHAQLAGADGVGALRRARASRLRDFSWNRGEEQRHLEELIADLEGGRAIGGHDLPPDRWHRH